MSITPFHIFPVVSGKAPATTCHVSKSPAVPLILGYTAEAAVVAAVVPAAVAVAMAVASFLFVHVLVPGRNSSSSHILRTYQDPGPCIDLSFIAPRQKYDLSAHERYHSPRPSIINHQPSTISLPITYYPPPLIHEAIIIPTSITYYPPTPHPSSIPLPITYYLLPITSPPSSINHSIT